jgi:DNA-binding PadR family transcriptional regulator
MFLFSEEGGVKRSERYVFIPYNYGACSFDIYRDLDALVDAGLIERSQEAWSSWPTYLPTAAGQENAAALMQEAQGKAINYLQKTKGRLFSQSFVEMLREIYKAYPKYAKNSLVKLA